jgi:hypothetical protein
VGFFLGGVLLSSVGFQNAVMIMALSLGLVWIASLVLLKKDLGRSKAKPKFTEIFSKSQPINSLSAARLFLFGARDVWFVVALPIYLSVNFGWDYWSVGGFLASWVIGYGLIQTIAPKITGSAEGKIPDGTSAFRWACGLTFIPALIAVGMGSGANPELVLIGGLLIFGGVFAVNSSLHSYLIVSYADRDGLSLDVGFYYMANALGRLLGTVLSGWVFQMAGFIPCLLISSVFVALAALISLGLPSLKRI